MKGFVTIGGCQPIDEIFEGRIIMLSKEIIISI
jgi:hypothetical protein